MRKVKLDIKKIRNKLNLTQEQLAYELGVSWTTISRWENDKVKPSPLALKQIQILCKGIK
ncbi:MAG: helix-turn-helix domain-containing protein [Candidatus Omnitrophota bacterium]